MGSTGGSTRASQAERVRQYFAQLDTNTIRRLEQLYRFDFEMFGYENYLLMMES